MNFKKTLLYLLLSIFSLIFMYNYIMPYFVFQNTGGIRRGMHIGEGMMGNNNYSNSNFTSFFIVFIIVIVGFIILDKILFSTNENKCKNCGLPIEDSQWKVCPRCGSPLGHREGK